MSIPRRNVLFIALSFTVALLIVGCTIYSQLVVREKSIHHEHVVFIISPGEDSFTSFFGKFKEELQQTHYLGDNSDLKMIYRDTRGSEENLGKFINEAISTNPDIIVTISGVSARAIQEKIPNIPILAALGDPVENGYVSSLRGSGNNIAGIAYQSVALTPKRLEILKKLSPRKIKRVAIFYDTTNIPTANARSVAAAHAGEIGLELVEFPVTNPTREELALALSRIDHEHYDALMFYPSAGLYMDSDLFLARATKEHLPIVMPDEESTRVGAVASYGPDYADMGRMLAHTANTVLDGTNPAEIPFRQSTKINFVINRKLMKEFGFNICPELGDIATKVVN